MNFLKKHLLCRQYSFVLLSLKTNSQLRLILNRTLSHPNLVKLIGVIKHTSNGVDKSEISLVTEFMPKGSLLDYLMSRGRTIVTKKELVDFVM